MKNKIKLAALIALVSSAALYAVTFYSGNLVNDPALAYNNTYIFDLRKNNVTSVSATSIYSPAVVASATFQDGAQATSNVVVANFAALNQAKATNQLTVVSTAGLSGAVVQMPGYWLKEGLDWKKGATANATAISLAAALNRTTIVVANASGSVVYSTAVAFGTYYNSISLKSNAANLVVAHPFFVGGLDKAVLKINGVPLVAGNDFLAVTNNNTTAANLNTAINANAVLKTQIKANAAGATVFETANLNGAVYNFALFSSSQAAMTLSGSPVLAPNGSATSVMTGGVTPDETLGSAKIHLAGHGLTLALPVLYTQGALLGGLANQTTYYAIPVDADNLKLASSAGNAIAGTGIVVTSTPTATSPAFYTLAPLSFSGVASFKWQASNDQSAWSDLTVSSVTVHAGDTQTSTSWDFGSVALRFMRANVIAPTTGGLQLTINMAGNSQ